MGDFNLGVLPLAETIDRRGEQYELGRAGANTSELGSFIQGATDTAKDVTAIRTAQLDAQTRYNPTRLAQEELKRDIDNKVMEAELEKARYVNSINAKYGETREVAEIDQIQASAGSARASAARNWEDVRISKATGIETAQSQNSLRRSQAEKYRVEADLERRFGAAEREAETRKINSEAFKNIDSLTNGGSSRSRKTDDDGNTIENLRSQSDLNIGGGAPAPADPSRISSQIPSQAITPLKSSLDRAAERYVSNDMFAKEISEEKEVSRKATELNVQATELAREHQTNFKAEEYADEIKIASKSDGAIQPSVSAALAPLTKLTEATILAKDSNDLKLRSSLLTSSLASMGTPDQIMEKVESEVSDPEQLKSVKTSLYKAFALSGDVQNLPYEQKELLNAFGQKLGPQASMKLIENPESVYENTSKLISGNLSDIQDSDFKRIMRDNDYGIAARKASKNGTQGFTVTSDRIPMNNQGDIAGQESSQKVTLFRGDDGTEAFAPSPQNDADHGVISIMEEVSKRTKQQAETKRFAEGTNQELEARNAPAPQPTPQAAPSQAPMSMAQDPAVQQGADIATPQNIQQADVVQSGPQAAPQTQQAGAPNMSSQPLLTDAELAQMTYAPDARTATARWSFSVDDPKVAATRGAQEEQQRIANQQQNQVKLEEEISSAGVISKRSNALNRILSIVADKPGLAKYLGAAGEGERNLADLVSKIPVAGGTFTDNDKAELMALGKEYEASGILSLVKSGMTSQLLNSNVERQGSIAFSGTLSNTPESLQEQKKFLDMEQQMLSGITQIRQEGIKLNLKDNVINQMINTFKDVGRPYQFTQDGKLIPQKAISADKLLEGFPVIQELRRRQGGSAPKALQNPLADQIRRERGQITTATQDNADQETQLAAPSQQVPPAPSGGGGPLPLDNPTPGSGEQPAAPLETTSEPAPVQDNASKAEEFSKIGIFSNTPAEEIKQKLDNMDVQGQGLPGNIGGFVKNAFVGTIDYIKNYPEMLKDEKTKLIVERSKQDPDVRAAVDAAKKAYNESTTTIRIPGVAGAEFDTNFINKVANGFTLGVLNKADQLISETASEKLQILGDAIGIDAISEKGQEIGTNYQARKESREDYNLDKPGEAFVANAVVMMSLQGAVKKGTVAVLGKAAEKVPALRTAIETLIGKQDAGSVLGKTAVVATKYLGNVANDAITAPAMTEEGYTDLAKAKDVIGQTAAASATLRPAIGTVGAIASPLLRGAKDLLTQANPVDDFARSFVAAGGTKEVLLDAMEKAAKESGGDYTSNVMTHLPDSAKEIFKTVLGSPSGQTALSVTSKQAKQFLNQSREGISKQAGLADVPDNTSINSSVRETLGNKVSAGISKAQANLETKAANTLVSSVRTAAPNMEQNIQQSLNEYSGLVGKKGTNIPYSKSSVNAGPLKSAQTRASNLGLAVEAVESQKGKVLKQAEKQWSKGFGVEEVQNLQSKLIEKFGDKGQRLINATSEELTGVANAGKIPLKEIGENITNYDIQPSFKFIAEMMQLAKSGKVSGMSDTATAQRSGMSNMIMSEVQKIFKSKGLNPSTMDDLFKQYGSVSELGKVASKQQQVFDDIAVALRRGDKNLLGKALPSGKMAEYEQIFGKQGAVALEKSLKQYDDLTSNIEILKKGGASANDIAKLGDDLTTAVKNFGDDVNVGSAILEAKDIGVIQSLKKAVGKKELPTLQNSILREFADRSKNFLDKNSSKVIPGDNFVPREVLNISSTQWKNAKAILSDEQVALVDNYLNRTISLNKLENLYKTGPVPQPKGFSAFFSTVLRRSLETGGLSILDLASGESFNALSKASQKAIAKQITNPDPAKVNDFIGQVAKLLKTVETKGGAQSVLDLPEKEWVNKAKALAVIYWGTDRVADEVYASDRVTKERDERRRAALMKLGKIGFE